MAEIKRDRDIRLLLILGIITFLLGYFCLGLIAPLIGIPVWIISVKKLSQIEGDGQLTGKKRLLNATLICSIIGVFNGPMMFFYIQPIDVRAFLQPIGAEKINYLAANCGLSLGGFVSSILIGSILFIPLLLVRKSRKWKVYFVFLTVLHAFFAMFEYAGRAVNTGLDEQSARRIGLSVALFYLSFIFAFFSKTRRWYFLAPLLILLGLLAGTQISHLN